MRSDAAYAMTSAPISRPVVSASVKSSVSPPAAAAAASCASIAASISPVLFGKKALSTAAEAPPMAAETGR
jgi:hypothetical protein